MSTTMTPLSRVSMSIGAALLLAASAALTVFAFTVLREDATDDCHILGDAFNFSPDTRWFGFAVIALIGSAYLFAKISNKPMGQILGVLIALWGVILIVVPHLV